MAFPALFQFAEYSNITSIAVVALCFLITTLFIFFFRLTDFPQKPVSVFGLRQRSMVKVQNPFVLSLDGNTNKLKDDLQLSLSALCPSTVLVLWGPKINPFHEFILLPGSHIRSKCLHPDRDLGNVDPLHIDILNHPEPGRHKIVLPCPDKISSSSLGEMPRQRYPVAVLVLMPKPTHQTEMDQKNQASNLEHSNDRKKNSDNAEGGDGSQSDSLEESNSIVGLISVIHLKDEIVIQPSYVITQYVKTAGVAIYSLQPLFMSNSNIPPPQTTESPVPSSTENLDDTTYVHRSSPHSNAGSPSGSEGDEPHSPKVEGEWPSSQAKDQSKDETAGIIKEGVSDIPTFPELVNQRQGNSNNCPSSSNAGKEENSIRKRLPVKGKKCGAEAEGDEMLQPVSSIPAGRFVQNATSSQRSTDLETETPDLSDCVVCQSRLVACVILPCRHTCVCIKCLKLLDKCPICRGPIDSYFMLTNEQDEEEDLDSESEDELLEGMQQHAVNWNMVMMFERFNERLNAMLGFR